MSLTTGGCGNDLLALGPRAVRPFPLIENEDQTPGRRSLPNHLTVKAILLARIQVSVITY
jgi:hypothetical protein